MTECDALAVTVKTQNEDLVEVRKLLKESEATHEEYERSFKEEKENLQKELMDVKTSLGQLEDEYLKLFKEWYRECWGRGEARGLDMEPDKFETYLGEVVKKKIKKGAHDAEVASKTGDGEA